MRQALAAAERGRDAGEVPIGCLIVAGDRLLGRDHNRVEQLQDPTAHAEILALSAAAGARRSWRLTGATLYVTVEPCAMCLGACYQARVARVVFGAPEPKFGACGSRVDLTRLRGLNHTLRVDSGVLAVEAAALMRGFFRSLRRDVRVVEGARLESV